MTSTWLVIPSGTRRQYLQQILDTSGVPLGRTVLINTANNQPTTGVHNLWSDELNIHKWWNMGIDFATERGATHVAVLNDDVQLIGDPINKVVSMMGPAAIGQPNINSICGYFFVLNAQYGLRADERFVWWYGDNDLYHRAARYGIAKVDITVRHLEPNVLTTQNPALTQIGMADKKLYDSIYV